MDAENETSEVDSPSERPDRFARPVWAMALFGSVCAGFLLWWLSLALRYPYFYLFDMDLLAPLEALNINSGLVPWVTQHPGYGMYVLDAFTMRIANTLRLVSISDLSSLEGSLSPLLPMAELTGFFRLHSPILVFAIALSLWIVVARIGRFSLLLSTLIFAAIASSEGLAYHAALVRVDLYSAFFWSLALPIAAMAGSSRGPRQRDALFVVAGFFLGVAFLTKIQSGIHLAAAAIVYALVRVLDMGPGKLSWETESPRARRFGLILAAINFCALAALLLAAKYSAGQLFTLRGVVEQPEDFRHSPSLRAVAVVVAAIMLVVLQIPKLRLWRPTVGASIAARSATPVVFGGILAILSPLVLYMNPAVGMRFALHNLQSLFWTNLFLFRSSEPTETILAQVSAYRWWTIGGLAAAIVVLAIAVAIGQKPRRWTVLAISMAWVGFAGAVTLGVMRTAPRDLLWFDTSITLATFAFLAAATRLAHRGRRSVLAATALITTFVCAGNFLRLAEFGGRMDTNYSIYGWSESPWFDTWFGSPRYNGIMAARYPEAARALAARQAREHYRLRGIVEHVFQNADVNLSNVGPLAVGQPLWRNHQEWTVSAFPKGYAFAHAIDPLEVAVRRRVFLSHVKKHEEWLDRIVPPPAEAGGQTPGDPVRALSILPRRDIEIVLFATVEDLGLVGASQKPEASLKIPAGDVNPLQLSLENKGQELRLEGAIVVHYSALPVGDFMGPYVFLVREKSLPAAYGFYTPKGGPEGEANPRAPLGGAAEGGVADETVSSNDP